MPPSGCTGHSRSALEEKGHRPIVDQMHLHVGTKAPGLHQRVLGSRREAELEALRSSARAQAVLHTVREPVVVRRDGALPHHAARGGVPRGYSLIRMPWAAMRRASPRF